MQHDPDGDGIVVRLDVTTYDPGRSAEVAETLARMAAGFAAEGYVASLLVHPFLDDEDDEEE